MRDNKAEIVALLRQEAASPPVERQAKIVAADNGATTVRKAPAKNHPALDTDLEAEIEERKGMAMGGVPEPYRARLQVQKPVHVTVEQWRQAIDDADRFADSFGWTPGDLFDVWRIWCGS